MNQSYYYSSPIDQQSSSTYSWISQPSFYNGYRRTNLPVDSYQSIPIVNPTYSFVQPDSHQQQFVAQSNPIVSSSLTMKSSNFFRQAFFNTQTQHSEEEYLYHEQQLNRNLSEHGFQRLPVKGDGNCLFYALAEGLIHEMNIDPIDFGARIRQCLHSSARHIRLSDFADRLRQLCVEQWRSNEDYYSQFVDQEKVTFLKEVKKFSKNGVSDSTLGDIVPLTIANALDIHMTIFTSVLDLRRIDVKSEHKPSQSSRKRKTIYLAYNQCGSGHYDAAYPRQ